MTISCWVIVGLLVLSMIGAIGGRFGAIRGGVYLGCLACCMILAVPALGGLNGAPEQTALPIGLPWSGVHLRIDAISCFFLLLLSVGGSGASLFAMGYTRHDAHPGRVLTFFPAFLASMMIVVLADDAFTFLFGWEAMSLASWALVVSGGEADAVKAGLIYLVMAVFSGLVLLLTFGLLVGAQGALDFDAIRQVPRSAMISGGVFLAALLGAGAKAGVVPLHVWLPEAHPAAPTHVSALMSGVMTKIALYGFIRIVFDLLGGATWWAGEIVLVVGGLTAVLGVLHAVLETDLKRLLAYSTVENIGVICVGLGLALAFRANGFPVLAALAMTAALFHALNHTIFKSLLFYGAGAVLHATRQRRLEALGGLIHRMPRTAIAVLVGCAAIAALPPLNGFASEWLTLQAILLHPELPQWGLKIAIPADGALLALATALAGACFVRAYGIAFLGHARSESAIQAREVDRWMQCTMLIFAVLCVVAGVLPGAIIDALAPVTQALTGARMPIQLSDGWQTIIPVAASRSSYNGLLILVFIAASTSLAVGLTRGRATRRGPAWDCGFADAAPSAQYSAAGLAQPLRRVFGAVVFRARSRVVMPLPGEITPATVTHIVSDPIWQGLYQPLGRAVLAVAERANRFQYLTIRRYLSFVFAALVILLLVLTVWQ